MRGFVDKRLPESWMDRAQAKSFRNTRYDIITTQVAVHLVAEHVGVAILTEPMAVGFSSDGVVLRPLSDTSLCFEACVIMRTDDDSRLANEFAWCFLRRYELRSLPPKQMELSLSA
jgi:hypothetical protein